MSNIIHQIATCTECSWTCDNYKDAKAYKEAVKHSRKTGHRVIGETGTCWSIEQKVLTQSKTR